MFNLKMEKIIESQISQKMTFSLNLKELEFFFNFEELEGEFSAWFLNNQSLIKDKTGCVSESELLKLYQNDIAKILTDIDPKIKLKLILKINTDSSEKVLFLNIIAEYLNKNLIIMDLENNKINSFDKNKNKILIEEIESEIISDFVKKSNKTLITLTSRYFIASHYDSQQLLNDGSIYQKETFFANLDDYSVKRIANMIKLEVSNLIKNKDTNYSQEADLFIKEAKESVNCNGLAVFEARFKIDYENDEDHRNYSEYLYFAVDVNLTDVESFKIFRIKFFRELSAYGIIFDYKDKLTMTVNVDLFKQNTKKNILKVI